jgi:hypothetical protein
MKRVNAIKNDGRHLMEQKIHQDELNLKERSFKRTFHRSKNYYDEILL